MNFIFYSPVAFEKWDWRNSVEKGIGGSETSHVEMAWRLARRGHNVISYCPIPDDCPGEWRGTKWYDIRKIKEKDFEQKGVWILYRCPPVIDIFSPIEQRKDQQIWFMMQDWEYPNWTEERIHNCDRIMTLSQAHGRYTIEREPLIAKNLWLTSNGIKIDLIEETEKRKIKRNPYRIMHASSPDRGLKQALISFAKAKRFVPELEFHAFYGFNNLEKLAKTSRPIKLIIADLKNRLNQPGVFFHGRVSQNELYEEWFKSGIYIYETNFFETSNIASMEAQACGAVPVYSPIFAQYENIKWGVPIQGDSYDAETNSRFAEELARVASRPQIQESIRPEMMAWARKRFDWEVFVTQWELEAQGKRKEFEKQYEFPVQI